MMGWFKHEESSDIQTRVILKLREMFYRIPEVEVHEFKLDGQEIIRVEFVLNRYDGKMLTGMELKRWLKDDYKVKTARRMWRDELLGDNYTFWADIIPEK